VGAAAAAAAAATTTTTRQGLGVGGGDSGSGARATHGGGFPWRGASLLSVAARPLREAQVTLRVPRPRAERTFSALSACAVENAGERESESEHQMLL
jgi:hypothetical protein